MSEIFASVAVLTGIASWLTSFIHAIKHSEWLLVLVDCVIWPVGIIHGLGLWFGWW